jgi:tetratricopeptide (TPR) repeat protein
MANFQAFLLATTVNWNNFLKLLLVSALFMSAPRHAFAQKELSAKERHVFNQKFFEAKALEATGDYEKAFDRYRQLYALDASNDLVHYELATFYTNKNQKDSALYHAEQAVALKPGNKWYTFMQAKVYEKFGFSKKRVALYQNLLAKEPTSEEYRYELAQAYLANQQPQKAIEELNALEEQMGKNQALTEQKKDIYLELGDVDQAINELRELIEAFPNTIEYYGTLGQIYSVNGFNQEAFEVYQQMLEVDSLDPRPHLDLANYYRQNQNFPQSLYHLKIALRSSNMNLEKKIPVLLSLFNASAGDSSLSAQVYEIMDYLVSTNQQDPRIYALYGDYLSRDGRDAEALENYKKALRLDGGQKFQIWEQVLLIQIQNNQLDSLAVYAPKAIENFPNQPVPYLFAGVAYLSKEKAQEAVYFLEDGLTYVFGNQALKEQFYGQLADAHHRLENHTKSDQYFEKTLRLNPNNATALNNYAYYLALRQENLERALELTQKSNNLSPNNPVFLDTWAWVLHQKGQSALALKKMEELLALEPQPDAEVLEHYGDILQANGQSGLALAQYQKAASLGKPSQSLTQKIEALQ